MALSTFLREWLGFQANVYECRDCGTTVDDETTTCPACGSDDIVEFELE